jgi:hypothetical protein
MTNAGSFAKSAENIAPRAAGQGPECAEEWRPVYGLDGYEVSDLGRVRSLRGKAHSSPKILKPYVNGKGYHMLSLVECNGSHRNHFVHVLVLEAFVGPRPDNMQCRHFPDPTPTNNALVNLQWGTSLENHADRRIHGTYPRLLTDDDVTRIRGAARATRAIDDVMTARDLDVSVKAVRNARTGLTHAHLNAISPPVSLPLPNRARRKVRHCQHCGQAIRKHKKKPHSIDDQEIRT